MVGPADIVGVVPVRHRLQEVLPWREQAVRELAEQLPPSWVDAYENAPQVRPLGGRTPVEALSLLDARCVVVRLLHMEMVPALQAPIRAAVEAIAPAMTPGEQIEMVTSVLYIGAPRSGASWHVDRHPNLFVQLAGTKRFLVGRHQPGDRRRATSASGGPPDDVTAHVLEPGMGLFVPPYTLHAVESSMDRTVSASLAWRTSSSRDLERLDSLNARLRRFGLGRGTPGRRPAIDRAKLAALRTMRGRPRS